MALLATAPYFISEEAGPERVLDLLRVTQDRGTAVALHGGRPLHLTGQPSVQRVAQCLAAAALPCPAALSREQLCWPHGLAAPSSLEWQAGRCPGGPGWSPWQPVDVSSGLQRWRTGGGDTEFLSYKPGQTQDPVTAHRLWPPTLGVSHQTRDLPPGKPLPPTVTHTHQSTHTCKMHTDPGRHVEQTHMNTKTPADKYT